MPNILQADFISIGFIAVLVGAGVGELLAQKLPHQRLLIGIALWVCAIAATLLGAGLDTTGTAPYGLQVSDFAVMRHMAMIGFALGAALMLTRRARVQQMFGVAGLATFGLPIITNLWLGSGLAQATYGV